MSTDTELREHRTSATAHVPEGVKLHMFECGTLKCHLENIKMNQGLGEEYEIPRALVPHRASRGIGGDRRRQRR
jgi:hypothetical protein